MLDGPPCSVATTMDESPPLPASLQCDGEDVGNSHAVWEGAVLAMGAAKKCFPEKESTKG